MHAERNTNHFDYLSNDMKTNGFQTSTRVPVAVFREEKFGHVCRRGVGYHKPRIIYSLKTFLLIS